MGQAYMGLGEWDDADKQFADAAALEPGNEDVRRQRQRVEQERQRENAHVKQFEAEMAAKLSRGNGQA